MSPPKERPHCSKIAVRLTAAERRLLLDDLGVDQRRIAEAIRIAGPGEPVEFARHDLDGLAGYLAAELVLSQDRAVGRRLDRLYRRLVDKLGQCGGGERGRENRAERAEGRGHHRVARHTSAERAIVPMTEAARSRQASGFRLTPQERESLIHATRLPDGLKRRLAELPPGTQFLRLRPAELHQIQHEVLRASSSVASPHKRRLKAVLDKVAQVKTGS